MKSRRRDCSKSDLSTRAGPAWFLKVVLVLIAAHLSFATPAGAQDVYRLGVRDQVKIKVSEWRPAARELFEWSSLSGEYTVSPGGFLSMAIIGEVRVEGHTPAEVSSIISDRLKASAGLVAAPIAAVEVTRYRPVYIVGAVEKPGEYDFRPGMSALEAISIAGGFVRAEMSLARFERETIIGEGEIRVQEAALLSLLLRRDRLLAEAGKANALVFSDDVKRLGNSRQTEQAMRAEASLFSARRDGLGSKVEAYRQTKILFEEELKTLVAKAVTQKRQQDLAQRELDAINSLVGRGLATSSRQVAVEQNLAQLQSLILDVELATARAKQNIVATDRAISDLRIERDTEVHRDLRETELALRQTTHRIGSLRLLITESTTTGPRLQQSQSAQASRVRLAVVRRVDGSPREEPATEVTALAPGDVLKVVRAPIEAMISEVTTNDGRAVGD